MKIVLYSPAVWPLDDALFDQQQHQLERLKGGQSEMRQVVSAQEPDLVLLTGFDVNEVFLHHLESLCSALPQATVVVYQHQVSPSLLMAMMRAGVRDVLDDCQPHTIRQLVERTALRLQNARPFKSRVLGVMTAKSGDGGSCVAANLACALAEHARVLVMDLNLPFGDLEMYLTSQASMKDLVDLSEEAQRLDRSLLDSMVHQVTPNLHLVISPGTFEKVVRVQPQQIRQLIDIVSRHYNYVVLNLGASLDQLNLSVLEQNDEICLVASTSLPSMRRASQILKLLKNIDYGDDKVSVVVNRFSAKGPITLPEMEKAIGKRVRFHLPLDDEGVQDSLLKGKPIMALQPNSKFSQAMGQWVSEITGIAIRKKSLWQRLRMK